MLYRMSNTNLYHIFISVLRGPGIEPQHCILESIEGSVTIHPIADENYVNGKKVTKPLRLTQGFYFLKSILNYD